MMLEKDIERWTSNFKEGSTVLPNHSRVSDRGNSKSPSRRVLPNKSKNSKSDKSLSKGKQNKSAVLNLPKEMGSKVRDEELKEALRKKKEHRERLKVRNL